MLVNAASGYEQARAESGRGENTTAAESVISDWTDLVTERGGHG
ncbi:hypothetical protein ABZ897_58690 [Nonomuraea sp. NPDC046802]